MSQFPFIRNKPALHIKNFNEEYDITPHEFDDYIIQDKQNKPNRPIKKIAIVSILAILIVITIVLLVHYHKIPTKLFTKSTVNKPDKSSKMK